MTGQYKGAKTLLKRLQPSREFLFGDRVGDLCKDLEVSSQVTCCNDLSSNVSELQFFSCLHLLCLVDEDVAVGLQGLTVVDTEAAMVVGAVTSLVELPPAVVPAEGAGVGVQQLLGWSSSRTERNYFFLM